jgi:hypothetical protein
MRSIAQESTGSTGSTGSLSPMGTLLWTGNLNGDEEYHPDNPAEEAEEDDTEHPCKRPWTNEESEHLSKWVLNMPLCHELRGKQT